jgi:chemotaxis protein CheD
MKVIVGVADMKTSNRADDTIVTYSLGSCIGVVIYDPVARAGGLLHYMLPDSSIDQEKAKAKPFMFADTGIPRLFKQAYTLGAKKNRIKVFIAGGAEILDQKGFFNIGRRNYMALKKCCSGTTCSSTGKPWGATSTGTVRLEIATGHIYVKTSGRGEERI